MMVGLSSPTRRRVGHALSISSASFLVVFAAAVAVGLASDVSARRSARDVQAANFLSWLDRIEGVDRRATLRWIDDTYGFGVFADEEHGTLEDGSLLLQVPLSAVVTRAGLIQGAAAAADKAGASAGSQGGLGVHERLRRVWEFVDRDDDAIALWLMRARAVGAERAAAERDAAAGGAPHLVTSPPDLSDPAEWWPYIAVLPASVSIPALWLQGKGGTDLLHDERQAADAREVRAQLAERFARALPAIREVFHDFTAARMAGAVAAYASLQLNLTVDEARAAGHGLIPPGVSPSSPVKATPLPLPAAAAAGGQLSEGGAGGGRGYTDPRLDFLTGVVREEPLPTPRLKPGAAAAAAAGSPVLLPGLGHGHDSFASFVWAATLVDSRALTIRAKRILVPFADMLNFEPAPGAVERQAAMGAAFLAYHQLDAARGRFRVLADRTTAKGAQVFEDYGDSDSAVYLQHHGMVPAKVTRRVVEYARGAAAFESAPAGGAGPASLSGGAGDADGGGALEAKGPSWVHSRVTRVDSTAANPFDCVRIPMPPLPSGQKGSLADKRRTLAQAAGLSPHLVNSTCVRPPAKVVMLVEGTELESLNVSGTSPKDDPFPKELHRWLAIAGANEAQLTSPACARVLQLSAALDAAAKAAKAAKAAAAAAAAAASGSPAADEAALSIPPTAAGTASSRGGLDAPGGGSAEAITDSDIDACLLLNAFERAHLLAAAERNSSVLDIPVTSTGSRTKLPGGSERMDDGSGPAREAAGTGMGPAGSMGPGAPQGPARTAPGRAARLLRRLLQHFPTKIHEDLALLTAAEVRAAATERKMRKSAAYALVASCVSSIQPVGRQRYLLAQTFGKDGDMYMTEWLTPQPSGSDGDEGGKSGDGAPAASPPKKASEEEGAKAKGTEGGSEKEEGEEAKEEEDDEEDPASTGAPRGVNFEHARLALLYRAARKAMIGTLLEWMEQKETAFLARLRVEAGLGTAEKPVGASSSGGARQLLWGAGDEGRSGAGGDTFTPYDPAGDLAAVAAAQLAVLDAHFGPGLGGSGGSAAGAPAAAGGGRSNNAAGATVAIGLTNLPARDAACFFTEDEFADAQRACDSFNAWFQRLRPPINAIKAVPVGGGMRLGVVATARLLPEEAYLAAPVDGILSADLAKRDATLGPVFASLRRRFPNGDDFHELLLLLLLEHGVRHPARASSFGPYLDTLPDADHMPFPLFFTPRELGVLLGSPLLRYTLSYRSTVRSKYASVSSAVVDAFPRVFSPRSAFGRRQYAWGTAILDSRAIWWSRARNLVPLLDLINCDEGPDASRVHATRLDPRGEHAVTRADRAYAPGDQLFENYGQPNWVYFAHHGFAMLKNSHDCVQLELELPPSAGAAVEAEQARRKARRKAAAASAAAATANRIEGAEGGAAAAASPSPSSAPASASVLTDAALAARADTAAWERMSVLLREPVLLDGRGFAPRWSLNESLSLPWAPRMLLARRGAKGSSAVGRGSGGAGEGGGASAALDASSVAWLADRAYSDSVADDASQAAASAGEARQPPSWGPEDDKDREEEEADVAAERTIWAAVRALGASGPPPGSAPAAAFSRVFATQCIKVDALMPPPPAQPTRAPQKPAAAAKGADDGEELEAVSVDSKTGDAAAARPASDAGAQSEAEAEAEAEAEPAGPAPLLSPLLPPSPLASSLPAAHPRMAAHHAETEEAISWLIHGWRTDRLGALLLLRSHARAALARYPTRLASDVRSLLADLAAQLVLGLADEEDARAGARALLEHVYGSPGGYRAAAADGDSSSLPATVTGGLPTDDEPPAGPTAGAGGGAAGGGAAGGGVAGGGAADGDRDDVPSSSSPSPSSSSSSSSAAAAAGSPLPGAYPLGRFTLVHWQSEVLAQAKESRQRLTRARASLLPPRVRASLQFLVTEKVQLLALAGWDPTGLRGTAGARYHPAAGACGAGKGGAGLSSGAGAAAAAPGSQPAPLQCAALVEAWLQEEKEEGAKDFAG